MSAAWFVLVIVPVTNLDKLLMIDDFFQASCGQTRNSISTEADVPRGT